MSELPSITVQLPRPPSTNNLYTIERGVGKHRTSLYNKWRKTAHMEILAQRPKWPTSHIGGKVRIRIRVQRISGRADIANREKAVTDALVHMGVIDDDRHVERMTLEWADDIEGCEVTIEPHRQKAGAA